MSVIVDAFSDVVEAVVDTVGTVVETALNNPLATIAMIAAPYAAPEIGAALGVSEAIAAPISAAVLQGAATGIQGGDLGDIVKSAAAGGFGNYVGARVGSAATNYAAENSLGISAATAGKIAGAGAGGATSNFVQTGDVEKALKAGIVGAGTVGALEAGKGALANLPTGGTTTVGERTSGGYQPGQEIQTYPKGGGFGGGASEVISKTSPFGTMSFDTMPNMTYDPSMFETKAAGKAKDYATNITGQYVSGQLSGALGLTPQTQSGGVQPSRELGGSGSAGSAALAQALRVGDPNGPLFGSEKTNPQQNVWNISSLKYKDETGS